jgi:hypothetical protein
LDDYLPLTSSPSGEISERMQALLSRAVDDQVNEQRQVQSLLTEVRAALAQVQDEVRAVPSDDLRRRLDEHVRTNGAALAQLQDRLEAMVRAVTTSAQVLQGISGQLDRLTESVAEQAAHAAGSEPVDQLRGDVGQLGGRLDAIERALSSRLDGIETLLRAELPGLQVGIRGDFESVRAATGESTRHLAQHIDNAVLVLAEALLRRPGVEAAAAAPTFAAPTTDERQRDVPAAEVGREPAERDGEPGSWPEAAAAERQPQQEPAPAASAGTEAASPPALEAHREPEPAPEAEAAEPEREPAPQEPAAAPEAPTAGELEPEQPAEPVSPREHEPFTAVQRVDEAPQGPFGDPPPGFGLPPAPEDDHDEPARVRENLSDPLSDPLPEQQHAVTTALDAPLDEVAGGMPWEDDPLSASFDADGTQWELSRLLDDTRPASGPSSPTDLRIHHAASGGDAERSTVDEFEGLGDPAWDLERALFGGRSRGVETPGGTPTASGTGAEAVGPESGQGVHVENEAVGAGGGSDDQDDDDEPRRRPWWRPGS